MRFWAIAEKQCVHPRQIGYLRICGAGIFEGWKQFLNLARRFYVGENLAERLGLAPSIAKFGIRFEYGAKLRRLNRTGVSGHSFPFSG